MKPKRNDRAVTARMLGTGLLLVLAFAVPSSAQIYRCGNPSLGHCYGLTSWSEQPEYFGAYSDIKSPSLQCPWGCGGFVDDEVWLVDPVSPACITNGLGACWIEAGYISLEGANGPVFFWAEALPAGGNSAFHLHLLGPADPIGVVDHFMLLKDGRVSPGRFLVWIYNDTLSTLYSGSSTSSTGVVMRATRIDTGQELAGTPFSASAFADFAHFTRNIWAVVPLGPEYVFWYAPQVTPGLVTSDNPPFGLWSQLPGSPGAPEGGSFTTHCCSF